MKIAISGKGGTGKTTLAALLARTLARAGRSVIAVDADPTANLAGALGIPPEERPVPISEMRELIRERTGSEQGYGSYFKLNPDVHDLPDKFSRTVGGVRLLTLGGVAKGGAGCICPESALLKALVTHLLLAPGEVVILDMEAGIEHLSRGTTKAVDRLIIVVEPGRRSIETAQTILKLAQDLGLPSLAVVGNKIRSEADREFIKAGLPGIEILGYISYDPAITEADLAGRLLFSACPQTAKEVRKIYDKLMAASRQPSIK